MIENKNKPNPKTNKKMTECYAIDGEDLQFTEKVTCEVLPGEIEVLVDYDFLISEEKYFVPK